MAYIIFFTVAFLILTLIYGYSGWRLVGSSSLSPAIKKRIYLTMILFIVLAILPIPLRLAEVSSRLLDTVSWAGYLGLGFFSLVFNFTLLRDIFLLFSGMGIKAVEFIKKIFIGESVGRQVFDPSKRQFLLDVLNLGVSGLSGVLSAYGFFESVRIPRVVEVSVPIKDLPRELEGFSIAQITDIHIGPTIKKSFLERVVRVVNQLDADIIALTGDLMDGTVKQLRSDMVPLKGLKSRYGNYFVTGNHEYYSGVHQWLPEINRLGFKILMDEHCYVQKGKGKILLAGVTDYSAPRMVKTHISSPKKAIEGAKEAGAKILLAHQPKSIYEASEAGFDLQISGHTHGGQFFPWTYLVKIAQPYIAGLHLHKNTWIYVSRGAGYWGPPIRLGAPSEITRIKLARA